MSHISNPHQCGLWTWYQQSNLVAVSMRVISLCGFCWEIPFLKMLEHASLSSVKCIMLSCCRSFLFYLQFDLILKVCECGTFLFCKAAPMTPVVVTDGLQCLDGRFCNLCLIHKYKKAHRYCVLYSAVGELFNITIDPQSVFYWRFFLSSNKGALLVKIVPYQVFKPRFWLHWMKIQHIWNCC